MEEGTYTSSTSPTSSGTPTSTGQSGGQKSRGVYRPRRFTMILSGKDLPKNFEIDETLLELPYLGRNYYGHKMRALRWA